MSTKHCPKLKPIAWRDLLGLTRDILKFLTIAVRLLNAFGKAQGWW
ncbi:MULTISPECIES: hypothetical protein [unclassified Bradyrhizobium]|nr:MULTISPECIES: hypothetical protein [unclassified Bradyrhizobium]